MLRMMTAGESHGPCLIAVIEGLPAGLVLDLDALNHQLTRRQGGYGRNFRQKIEHDRVEILGGLIYGKTIGAPLAMRIENRDWLNWKEKWASGDLPKLTIPRPGHADYAGMIKYGVDDGRLILERSSARETAARVAVGAVARQLLEHFGIHLGGYVQQIGTVKAVIPPLSAAELWTLAEQSEVRCPDPQAEQAMKETIDNARRTGDTLGGIFTLIATGVPVGLGSHAQWDRRLDARIAAATMSIQAIKGVEVGDGFESAGLPGTVVHDDLYPDGHGGVTRRTNHAGGLEGGMTNGADVVVRAAMKPIATTAEPHNSVDLATGQAAKPIYQRSDWCAVPAASVVGESMLAWVLAEALVEKLGGDSLAEMQR
jgi:chorismate synthase